MRDPIDMPTARTRNDLSDSTGCAAALGVVMWLPVTVLGGWVLSVLWGWFIAPVTGWPEIGVWQAAGVWTVVALLKYDVAAAAEDRGEGKRFEYAVKLLAGGIVVDLYALGCGFIIHSVMS